MVAFPVEERAVKGSSKHFLRQQVCMGRTHVLLVHSDSSPFRFESGSFLRSDLPIQQSNTKFRDVRDESRVT
jgi:hypothetical protein